jgi:hypothetical protein
MNLEIYEEIEYIHLYKKRQEAEGRGQKERSINKNYVLRTRFANSSEFKA